MYKKLFPLIFLVVLVALILFQNKAIMPLVEEIAASDLFLVETGDVGSRYVASTDMTDYAFIQCNKEVREEIDEEINILFPTEPLQSWTLGDFKYIVNAELELIASDGSSSIKKYACHLEYDEETNMEGIMDADNWTILGLSGL